jgi:hypothetical protein
MTGTGYDSFYAVKAKAWGRIETPTTLAYRWVDLIKRLQDVDPSLANWYRYGEGDDPIEVELDPVAAARFIEAKVLRNDDGTPQPLYGYQCSAYNTPKPRGPDRLTLHMLAGGDDETNTDRISLDGDLGLAEDPTLLTYEIFRGATLALAESFDVFLASAYSWGLQNLWPRRQRSAPMLYAEWISYIGPRYAHLVTPPQSAVVERRPDGGLLMAATDETFVTANPAHLAAARDIEAAVAPFNAQLEAEYEIRMANDRRAWAEAARRRAAAGQADPQ